MPEPLTWNNFVWNGTVNNHTTMTQDLITLDITDADWTAIDGALTTLEEKLGAKLLDLTVEQSRENGVSVQIVDNICIPSIALNLIGSAPLPSGRQRPTVATLENAYALAPKPQRCVSNSTNESPPSAPQPTPHFTFPSSSSSLNRTLTTYAASPSVQ